MRDPKKSRKQLLDEIAALRGRLEQLEDAEGKWKHTEEALRQSERDKSLILGSLSELISYQDTSLKVVWVNKAAGDSVGRSPEELVGRYCYEIWHRRKEPCLNCPVQKSIETGRPQEGEITTPDGRVWYMRGCPVLNEQGEVVGAVEATLDITDRKRAEAALRESEDKYRTLLQNLPQNIFYKDTNSVFVSCNENFAKDLGIESKEIVGKTDYDFYPKALAEKYRSDDRHVMESGRTEECDETYVHGGQEYVIHIVKTPVTNEDGDIVGVLGIFWDITDRKRTDRALEYRRNFEKLIMNISRRFINLSSEQVDEGIEQSLKALGEFIKMDRISVLQFCDDGREANTTHEWCAEGITPQKDNFQNIHTGDYSWWMDKLRRFENIHIPDVEKLPASAKNEKEVLKALSVKSLTIIPMVCNRELAGVVSFESVCKQRVCSEESVAMLTIVSEIFANVLMRKRVQQELDVHYEKMRRAEQLASLGMVSATVAHELNQPLTVMRLFLQQGLRALKEDDVDKIKEVIDDCLSEVTKAASTVDRFRRFARKAAPLYVTEVDLVEVAERVAGLLTAGARRSRLNLSVNVENRPPHIIGNSVELEQMFFVLIQNAIQATDGETQQDIKITISSADNSVQLTFADTCGGIEQKNMDKIFEPFFTTKPANVGTGLGLCILERIVKGHGGSVRVESQEGHGTIFYISLPVGN